jgi:hypothetical protein
VAAHQVHQHGAQLLLDLTCTAHTCSSNAEGSISMCALCSPQDDRAAQAPVSIRPLPYSCPMWASRASSSKKKLRYFQGTSTCQGPGARAIGRGPGAASPTENTHLTQGHGRCLPLSLWSRSAGPLHWTILPIPPGQRPGHGAHLWWPCLH